MGGQYYAVGSDGLRHGPVELTVLQQWANEGRLTADSIIIDSQGKQVQAGTILSFPFGSQSPGPNQPMNPNGPPPSPYLNGGNPPPQPGNFPQAGNPNQVPNYGSPGLFQPGPHWMPPMGGLAGPLSGGYGYDPLLYGPQGYGSTGSSGCITAILGLIGFELCCGILPGIIGLAFSIYLMAHGKPYGKLMVWIAGICTGLQLAATVMWGHRIV